MDNKKNHTPKKRFGQNFLTDQWIIQEIVNLIYPHQSDYIIEIGPGLGALTKPILESQCDFTAIELDKNLIDNLNRLIINYPNANIIQSDILKFDLNLLIKNKNTKLRIIGNLPYNISTPILFYLLNFKNYILDMHFMLQKEVVSRLSAQCGTKQYGRLSIITQYFCEVSELLDVPPEAFDPKPKVNSSIVKLTPRKIVSNPINNLDYFKKLITLAFNTRRKTLWNNLKKLDCLDTLKKLNIDYSLRPEQITINQYINLSNELSGLN